MSKKLKVNKRKRFPIILFFTVVVIFGLVFLVSTESRASTTWCNMYGDSKVCNTYRIDGTMTQETETPYGNSTVKTRTESPYKSE